MWLIIKLSSIALSQNGFGQAIFLLLIKKELLIWKVTLALHLIYVTYLHLMLMNKKIYARTDLLLVIIFLSKLFMFSQTW